jgi:hypothetical protein
MGKISDIFSTRELALLIWMFFIIVGLTVSKSFKKPILEILKLLLTKQFIFIYGSLVAYIFISTQVLHLIHLWDFTFLKDTIFWFFSFAIVTFFSIDKAKEINFFKSILKNSFRWTIFLEFLINFYSFSLTTELLLLPLITFIALSQAFAEIYGKNKKVSKVLYNILSIIGLAYFVYALYRTILDYKSFFTVYNLKSLGLPILLTILILPFFYFLALYKLYDELFRHVNYLKNGDELKKNLNWEMFKVARFSLGNVIKLKHNINKFDLYNSPDINSYFKTLVGK